MSVIEKAVAWALKIANDPAHGYDQLSRWGPNYDCSSFVIMAFKLAGLLLEATYTGNMKYDFLRHGFVVVTDGTLKRGDVLLHEKNHTALYIGNGQIVQASINERGGITGGQTGDQTGDEIHVRGYYDYPWDCVLRYVGDLDEDVTEENDAPVPSIELYTSVDLPQLARGDIGPDVEAMQSLLIHKWHTSCGPDGADGDFGPNTENALKQFQSVQALGVDGICGTESWGALIKGGE
jgi:peptidoglycan hydrolase-like protein with peptidoglycan-binding domain